MGNRAKPNRTCEPVMVNREDVDLVDGIIAQRYGKEIVSDMAKRKELVQRRKEVFHELIEAGWNKWGMVE